MSDMVADVDRLAKTKSARGPKTQGKSFPFPMLESPVELPAFLTEMTRHYKNQATDVWAGMQAGSDELASACAAALDVSGTNLVQYNTKMIQALAANTSAWFETLGKLAEANSPTEAMQCLNAHVCRQVDAGNRLGSELTMLAQKTANEIVKPATAVMSKAFGPHA